jgi:hypothetical protein
MTYLESMGCYVDPGLPRLLRYLYLNQLQMTQFETGPFAELIAVWIV